MTEELQKMMTRSLQVQISKDQSSAKVVGIIRASLHYLALILGFHIHQTQQTVEGFEKALGEECDLRQKDVNELAMMIQARIRFLHSQKSLPCIHGIHFFRLRMRTRSARHKFKHATSALLTSSGSGKQTSRISMQRLAKRAGPGGLSWPPQRRSFTMHGRCGPSLFGSPFACRMWKL